MKKFAIYLAKEYTRLIEADSAETRLIGDGIGLLKLYRRNGREVVATFCLNSILGWEERETNQ